MIKVTKRKNAVLVGFIIGIPTENLSYSDPGLEDVADYLDQLQRDENLLVLRKLCTIRSLCFYDYNHLKSELQHTLIQTDFWHNDSRLKDDYDWLSAHGINIESSKHSLDEVIVKIHGLLGSYLDKVKSMFSGYIEFKYLRRMIVSPYHAISEIPAAVKNYKARITSMPYHRYLYFKQESVPGYLLGSDKSLVTELYKSEGVTMPNFDDKFEKPIDAVEDKISDFLYSNNKIFVVVDCENSRPAKVVSFCRSLSAEQKEHIAEVVLIVDDNCTQAWLSAPEMLGIKCTTIKSQRVKQNKSAVDIDVVLAVSERCYKYEGSSFILCASDCDYYPVITKLNRPFMVLYEQSDVSSKFTTLLDEQGVIHCDLATVSSADDKDYAEELIKDVLLRALSDRWGEDVETVYSETIRTLYMDVDHVKMHNMIANDLKVKVIDGKLKLVF